MPKEKKKTNPTVDVQAWIAKHEGDAEDLKALKTAVAVVERRTAETQTAANKLGEALEARKVALKALKVALKDAKAARKAPKKTPVPKAPAPKEPAPKTVAPKAAAPKATPSKKAAPTKKTTPPKQE